MSANTFGTIFKVTTFGESHGPMVGVVIDGCPSDIYFDHALLLLELQKRRPGQSFLTTERNETDTPQVVSGIYENKTTGAPITILIKNEDKKSDDYLIYKDVFRPSHADFTYWKKYGNYDYRGGGRASARETTARVAAGAVAKMLLKPYDIGFFTYTSQIGEIKTELDYHQLDLLKIEDNAVRCPDESCSEKMIQQILKAKEKGDSLGGIVTCVIKNCPAGLGEPVFDKIEADLAKAMLSINATKGFEIGLGFKAAAMKGSEYNDSFGFDNKTGIYQKENKSGGTLGGISSGADIYFNVAFKPVSTIELNKKFMTKLGKEVEIKVKKGRHDPCVVPRAVPVVEAMAAIVLADHLLRHNATNVKKQ